MLNGVILCNVGIVVIFKNHQQKEYRKVRKKNLHFVNKIITSIQILFAKMRKALKNQRTDKFSVCAMFCLQIVHHSIPSGRLIHNQKELAHVGV